MEYLIIAIGIVAILFRKQISAFKNRIQPGIPKSVKERAGASSVEKTTKGVVTLQEITTAIIGALFILFGILAKFGIIHIQQ